MKPAYEDTRFAVILSSLVLLAESIAGSATFEAAGFAPGARVERRFRKWFAQRLHEHLEPPQ